MRPSSSSSHWTHLLSSNNNIIERSFSHKLVIKRPPSPPHPLPALSTIDISLLKCAFACDKVHNLQFHGYIIIPLGQVHKLCGYYYSYANDLIATRLRKTINPPIPMKLAIGHWRRDACHFIDTTTHGSSSIRPANILIIVSTPLTHFAWNVIHDLKSR